MRRDWRKWQRQSHTRPRGLVLDFVFYYTILGGIVVGIAFLKDQHG
jgi:hypothetical protein